MSRIFGLLFGLLLACAGFWVYLNFDSKTVDKDNGQPISLSSEAVHAEKEQDIEGDPILLEPLEESQEKNSSMDLSVREAEKPIKEEVEEVFSQPSTEEKTKDIKEEKYWQIIWSPFRTRRSATGFATRINGLTGLEMDVKKSTSGKFQVAFSYKNDEEKKQNIHLIENQICLTLIKGDQI